MSLAMTSLITMDELTSLYSMQQIMKTCGMCIIFLPKLLCILLAVSYVLGTTAQRSLILTALKY